MLQTNKIAELKAAGLKGLWIHTLIVIVIQLLGMSVFGIRGIAAGLICGIVHFFIDYLKFFTNKYFVNMQLFYFIFDQIMHIFLIFLMTVIFASESCILSLKNIIMVKLLISIIILTYVSSVSVKILLRDLNSEVRNSVFFYKNERIIDALIGLILWANCFLPLHLCIIFNIIVFYVYQKYQKKHYKYDYKLILIKYAALVAISYFLYLWWRK